MLRVKAMMNDWVKHCISIETDATRWRKTWWDCVNYDMSSFVLTTRMVMTPDKYHMENENQGSNPLSQVYLKMAIKCFAYVVYCIIIYC